MKKMDVVTFRVISKAFTNVWQNRPLVLFFMRPEKNTHAHTHTHVLSLSLSLIHTLFGSLSRPSFVGSEETKQKSLPVR